MGLTSGTKSNKSHIQSCLYVEGVCILDSSTYCEQQLLEQRKYFFKEDHLITGWKHSNSLGKGREKTVFLLMKCFGVAPQIFDRSDIGSATFKIRFLIQIFELSWTFKFTWKMPR